MEEQIKELAINYAITRGNVIKLVIRVVTESEPIDAVFRIEVKHNGIPVDEMTVQGLQDLIIDKFCSKSIYVNVSFFKLKYNKVIYDWSLDTQPCINYKGVCYHLSLSSLHLFDIKNGVL